MKILAYCCEWGGYASADEACKRGIPLPAGMRMAEVRCVGQLDPGALLEPLLYGVHGVLLAGCKRERCHYVSGNIMAQARVELAQRLLALCNINPGRIRLVWLDVADGEGFARESNEFMRAVASQGASVSDDALSLRAALLAAQAEKLRWLAGVGYNLQKTGNVFGRVLTSAEYSQALDEVTRDAFLRARVLLLLAQSPRTPREIAEAAKEDLGCVSRMLTALEKEGKIRHHSELQGLPRFTALAG